LKEKEKKLEVWIEEQRIEDEELRKKEWAEKCETRKKEIVA
jgi:hypothetical protein